MSHNRLAILPDVTHYDIFDSPQRGPRGTSRASSELPGARTRLQPHITRRTEPVFLVRPSRALRPWG
ncbi:MAG TPA: hypothetical protein VFG30_10835 [Polyangiales bacterium]|nr:hypothetical protein [Polyangiales bacterium]